MRGHRRGLSAFTREPHFACSELFDYDGLRNRHTIPVK
jgi:hypothetical protein